MKQIASLFIVLLIGLVLLRGQQPKDFNSTLPAVQWKVNTAKLADGVYALNFLAEVEEGWKISSVTASDEEPVFSRFQLDTASAAFFSVKNISEKEGKLIQQKEPALDNMVVKFFEKKVAITVILNATIANEKGISGNLAFVLWKGNDFRSENFPFRFFVDAKGNISLGNTPLEESATEAQIIKRPSIDVHNPVNKFGGTGGEDSKGKSLWSIFILGVLGGLVGLIMPCTFPMIPLTVSFFTKKSANKQKGIFNAFLYGFFIFFIYVLISVPFYFLDAGKSDILNNISTNVWLNLLFAIIFVVFAISFFGFFEITLPSGFANTIDSKSDSRTWGGIFFMALTLVIVSFSCTGPLLGSLVVGALNQSGSAIQLTIALAGFGLALGLPFALFALFPNWLSSLPKSGGWMDTVKVVLGFIELAFAIKFLSNADLVKHWGLLKREIFIGLWMLIGIALVLYLLGILKFKKEASSEKPGKGRIAVALFFLAFVIYLIPGLTNTSYANLKLLSGFPPPLDYSIYGSESVIIVNDYEKALQVAKEKNKPILIDFTGWACVNCRKMEENIWTVPAIHNLIKNKFVLVSLYVDDRKLLPYKEHFVYKLSDGSKKNIKTVGDKYITFQSENFSNASQPLYAIVSPNEQLLNFPVGYTSSAADYKAWLENGLEAFKKVAK